MPEFSVSFELVDSKNRTARKTWTTLTTTTDFAAAAAAAAPLFTDLAVLTGLRVLAYTINQRIIVTDAVTAGSNRDEGLTLSLRKEDLQKGNIHVPGPIDTIFDANGNVITTPSLHTAVANFILHFTAGSGEFTFSDGEQLVEFVSGVLDK